MEINQATRHINIRLAKAKAKRGLLSSSVITVTITILRHSGKTRAITEGVLDHAESDPSPTQPDNPDEPLVSLVDRVVEEAIAVALVQLHGQAYGTVSVEIERSGESVIHARTIWKDQYREDDEPRHFVRRRAG